MKLIDSFEKDIGKQVAYLDQDSFLAILHNRKLVEKYFLDDDKCQEILREIAQRNVNEDFKASLLTLQYKLLLVNTERKLDLLFKSYRDNEINREELLKKMDILRHSEDPVVSVSAFLCTFIALPDISLVQEKENVLNGIEGLHRILNSLGNVSESYVLRTDIVDLIYELSEWYFSAYGESLEKQLTWLPEELEKLNAFEDSFLEEIPDAGVSPEKLGYIDITKFNRKE